MKVVIAGGRDLHPSYRELRNIIKLSGFSISYIISGMASGVDTVGWNYAGEYWIPRLPFPADWSLGRKAGHLRNKEMAEAGDALIAIWDGKSPGTRNMINQMKKLGKPVYIYRWDRYQYKMTQNI